MTRIVQSTLERLRCRRCQAKRESVATFNASNAPTRHDLIRKGQALVDRNHDCRLYQKYAQVGPKRWITWNFDVIDHIEITHELMLYVPRFVRVRKLQLTYTLAGKNFVQCTCHGRKREGVPCSCFFRISDDAGVKKGKIVDFGMIDARI